MHIHVQIFISTYFSFILEKDLETELVGHMTRKCLTLKESAKIFFKVVVQFYTPTISSCSTSLKIHGITSLFNLAKLLGVK